MKTVLKSLILLLICLLFFECRHNHTTRTVTDTKTAIDSLSISRLDNKDSDAFNPILTTEIKDYIIKYCNLEEEKIILLWSEKDHDNSYLCMVTNYFFVKERLKGYSIVDDKMIAFYGSEGKMRSSLLDTNKLIIGYPENYPDETSDIAYTWDYDPKMRKYRIIDADRIKDIAGRGIILSV